MVRQKNNTNVTRFYGIMNRIHRDKSLWNPVGPNQLGPQTNQRSTISTCSLCVYNSFELQERLRKCTLPLYISSYHDIWYMGIR